MCVRGSADEGEVTIESNRAVLEGSKHVTDLNLQERYACSARFAWSAVSPVRLCCAAPRVLPSHAAGVGALGARDVAR
jgi:hypothetical protein